jgi:hypothetical protein
MEPEPLRGVSRPERLHRIGRHSSRRRHVGQRPAIRPSELERTLRQSLELVPLFVNRTVMAAAE